VERISIYEKNVFAFNLYNCTNYVNMNLEQIRAFEEAIVLCQM
jgi:hypothetical protein